MCPPQEAELLLREERGEFLYNSIRQLVICYVFGEVWAIEVVRLDPQSGIDSETFYFS